MIKVKYNLTHTLKKIATLFNKPEIFISVALISCLWLFYGTSLLALFTFHDTHNLPATSHSLLATVYDVINDDYIKHIITFSFFQALLSAFLSIFLGLIVAHAIFHQQFWGKKLLITVFSLSMVLPVLVAIFGLLAVYGHAGWLRQLSEYFGWSWQPSIYGLTGIVLAHIFFNVPLSVKVLLHSLSSVPEQQQKLAHQLGVFGWNFVRLVELPYVRQQLPALFTLIFMLCFTSFTVVLVMGGSPKYTTLEVAIYQAVVFNFELGLASVLALVQFVFCFTLFALSNLFTKPIEVSENITQHQRRLPMFQSSWRVAHTIIIIITVLFIGLPLLAIIIKALDIDAWTTSLKNPQLYEALAFSLSIALCAGCLAVSLAVGLLIGARQLYWLGFRRFAHTLVNMGMLVLAVPTLVLAVGLFLWLRSVEVTTVMLFAIVVFCNALMGMPFALRLLAQPFYNNMNHYEKLCQSLNITGIARFKHIEWHSLKKPIQSALALTIALSLGDFTAIALFGTQDFTSLPHLLYQQLGSYRHDQAAVSAFILLALCLAIFRFVESDT